MTTNRRETRSSVHVRPDAVAYVTEPQNGLSLRALVTGEQSGGRQSVTWVHLDGTHRRLRSRRSTRTYYVLRGAFCFEVDDAPPVHVGADEVLVLPAGATYGFSGRGTYLVLNSPAFAAGDDEYVDPDPPQRT